ncbi:MAG: YbjN domain-containing protein [Oscillospiraceae bacterium]|nr:YbjN domain-containing protein [Oscillospiraceae bacterium]
MFKAIKAICKVFDENDIKYVTETDEDSSTVITGIASELTKFNVLFISESDDNDVAMRVYDFISFKPKKLTNVLKLINRFNNEYRYVRFSVDEDNTVSLSYDFMMSCKDPGETALEIFLRLYQGADEFYEQLMKIIR